MVTTTPTLETEYRRLQEAAKAFGFRREAALIETHVKGLTQPFMLYIMGRPGSGKSSLINYMLGRNISPIGQSVPWLNVYRRSHTAREYAELHPANGGTPELMPLSQAIRLMETASTGNAPPHFDRIVWHVQSTLFPANVALVETPNLEPAEFADRYAWEADGLMMLVRADQLNLRHTQAYVKEARQSLALDVSSMGVLTHMDRVDRSRWMRALQQAKSDFAAQFDAFAPCILEPDELDLVLENPNDVLLREVRNRFYTSAERIKNRNRGDVLDAIAGDLATQFEHYVDLVLENRWTCQQFEATVKLAFMEVKAEVEGQITAFIAEQINLLKGKQDYEPPAQGKDPSQVFERNIQAYLAQQTQRIFSQLQFNEEPMAYAQQHRLPMLHAAGGDGAIHEPPTLSFRLPDLPHDAILQMREAAQRSRPRQARIVKPVPKDPFMQPAEVATQADPFMQPAEAAVQIDPFMEPAEMATQVDPFMQPAEAATEVNPFVEPAEVATQVDPFVQPAEAATWDPTELDATTQAHDAMAAWLQSSIELLACNLVESAHRTFRAVHGFMPAEAPVVLVPLEATYLELRGRQLTVPTPHLPGDGLSPVLFLCRMQDESFIRMWNQQLIDECYSFVVPRVRKQLATEIEATRDVLDEQWQDARDSVQKRVDIAWRRYGRQLAMRSTVKWSVPWVGALMRDKLMNPVSRINRKRQTATAPYEPAVSLFLDREGVHFLEPIHKPLDQPLTPDLFIADRLTNQLGREATRVWRNNAPILVPMALRRNLNRRAAMAGGLLLSFALIWVMLFGTSTVSLIALATIATPYLVVSAIMIRRLIHRFVEEGSEEQAKKVFVQISKRMHDRLDTMANLLVDIVEGVEFKEQISIELQEAEAKPHRGFISYGELIRRLMRIG